MRTLLALIVTGFALASSAAQAEDQPVCLKVDKIKATHRYLKPGEKMTVKVRLKPSHCYIAVDANTGTPANFFIEPRPVFESTSGGVSYSAFKDPNAHSDVSLAGEVEAEVYLKAVQFVPAGKYDVHAWLSYKAVDEQGHVRDETVSFTIPVSIAKPTDISYWDEHQKLRDTLVTTGAVVLGIALLPVVIVLSILGAWPEC
jgi:hypothetical protein